MPLSWNEIKAVLLHFQKSGNRKSEDAEAKSFWDGFFNIFALPASGLHHLKNRERNLERSRVSSTYFGKGTHKKETAGKLVKYILTQLIICGEAPEVEISCKEYQELKKAKEILSECLAVEERFEFIVSNFLDLEKEVLSLCADNMVRHESSYEHLFEIRHKCNRRLINLLTTTKLYIDQAEKRLYKLFENNDQENIKEKIGKFFKNEFDSFVEYQFMEGIRNHVQHAGLPIHLTNSGASRSETADSRLNSI